MRLGLIKRNSTDRQWDAYGWDLDRVFDDFFTMKPIFEDNWNVRLDVSEDDKAFHVTAEIPGLSEKDVSVVLEKNVLTISGEKNEERDEKDEKRNILLSERRYGSFTRSINIPEGVNPEGVKAEFKHGVLSIELPKDESAKPKRIEVKVH